MRLFLEIVGKKRAAVSLILLLAAGCKSPGPIGASDAKAVFTETTTGAEVVYDLSECIAKAMVPSIDAVFSQALDEVGVEIAAKIKNNPSLRDSAVSSLDVVKAKVDFSGVTTNARSYLEDQKAAIYGVTGFKLASLIPTGFVIGFYHPVLDVLPVDRVMKPVASALGITTKYFPFVALVVVPTCYQTIGPDGAKSPVKTRFRIGAMGNFMWQVSAGAAATPAAPAETAAAVNVPPPPAAAPAAAPGAAGSPAGAPWRVVLGFTWGSLYDPEQLSGPILGFGISKKSGSKEGQAFASDAQTMTTSTGSKIGLVFRPMIVVGSSKPRKVADSVIDKVADTLKKVASGDLSAVKPTHLMLLVDIFGAPTQKSYVKLYGGFNIVSSKLVEGFFERPVVLDESGKVKANPLKDKDDEGAPSLPAAQSPQSPEGDQNAPADTAPSDDAAPNGTP